jgi:hypothetical protein
MKRVDCSSGLQPAFGVNADDRSEVAPFVRSRKRLLHRLDRR